MDESTRFCARLLREGAILREELPELDEPEIRREVEKRLETVGLVLSTSAYSEYVGLRLSADIASDSAFDAASNIGLNADSCALLVILWARLVLQKRTASDTREIPGAQPSLLPDERVAAARKYKPQVRLATLVREFGHVLGSPTHVKGLVSQLRKKGFLGGLGETIEPGALLELGIDGERMVTYIRRQVLADLLQQKSLQEPEQQADNGDESKALNGLREFQDGAGMTQLEKTTGMSRSRLRTILRDLIQTGKVQRVGEHTNTRYRVLKS